jgi:hypothetical protein
MTGIDPKAKNKRKQMKEAIRLPVLDQVQLGHIT